jgi:hypothetical protein
MKRILLTLLAAVVVLGLFAAVGFTGYRFGYAQGVQATANGDEVRPRMGPFDDLRPGRMPRHNFGFERGFGRGFGMDEFRMGGAPWIGFGLFSLWSFLWRIAVLGLIIWVVYWLFTRSGWRLTRTTQTIQPEPPPVEPEAQG